MLLGINRQRADKKRDNEPPPGVETPEKLRIERNPINKFGASSGVAKVSDNNNPEVSPHQVT